MKKLLALLIAIAIFTTTVAVSGCGDTKATTGPKKDATTPAKEKEKA